MTASSLYKSFILNGISKDGALVYNSVKKSFNILLTYNLFVSILIMLIYSFNGLSFELFITTVSALVIACLHILVKYGYYSLSVILCNLFFSISFAVLICSLPGEIDHIASGSLVLILIATLFVRNRNLQLGLIVFDIVILLGSIYYSNNYPPILDLTVHPTIEILIYMTSAVNIAVIGYSLIRQLKLSEDQIQTLISSLQDQNVKLNASNQELEKMTYLATHDLKSPVRSMISFLGLIKRELGDTDLESAKTFCDLASDGATQMNNLINATLNYSQINCGTEISKEHVDVNQVIAKIENITELTDQQVEISYNNLPDLYTCGTMLYKLLQNLIENGLKYNQSPIKKISIDGKIVDNVYYLSVADNGIGIEPKYHEEIFKMYTRLHNNREYAGTGLGLAICRRICHQIDGEISIDPSVKDGTKFIISIPFAANAQGLVA